MPQPVAVQFFSAALRHAACRRLISVASLVPVRYGRQLITLAASPSGPETPSSQRYAFTIAYFMDHQKRDGYDEAMGEFIDRSALDGLDEYFAEAPNLIAGAKWDDIHTYLADDLRGKVDVASMVHLLESCSPLLNRVLMEWTARLPLSVKMAGGQAQTVFKKAVEPCSPRQVPYRRKMGLGYPVSDRLCDERRETVYGVLVSRAVAERGIFPQDYVERLLEEHVCGRVQLDTRLWAPLILELWFRAWMGPLTETALSPRALAA